MDPGTRTAGTGLAVGAAVGLAVGAAALAVALRDVDPTALAAAFARAGLLPLLVGAAIHVLVQALYAWRWRVLLGHPDALPTPRALGVVGLGYLANYTLPGRPGELVRAGLARGLAGVPLTLALASLVLEKVLDGASILLSALAFAAIGGLPPWLRVSMLAGGVAFGVGGALLGAVVLAPRVLARAPWARAPALGGGAAFLERRLAEIATPTGNAARSVRAILALGLLIWLTILAHLAVLAVGVGLPPAPAAWLLLYAALGLASVVPGAPGYVGTYQLAAVLALGLFGVERESAFVVATLYQLSRLLGGLVVGSWAVGREGPEALRLARFGFLARRARAARR